VGIFGADPVGDRRSSGIADRTTQTKTFRYAQRTKNSELSPVYLSD
jgi:hypothetical protein